jgi:hypothetical protein
MPLFRKKPIVVEAVRFVGGNFSELIKAFPPVAEWKGYLDDDKLWCLEIPTKEGTMTAKDGDWIVKEPNPTADRKFYPIKDEIFESIYDPVGPVLVCPDCGSKEVQLCFPVWVDANDIDDKEKYELDYEAQPEKDSTKGYCLKCEKPILVKEKDA